MNKNLLHVAAFSAGERGGNPAGVVISDHLPPEAEMQRQAKEVGYSETVFAAKIADYWRVRYFSPESEIPFCGHATIALGAALAIKFGDGIFHLQLNNGTISVEGKQEGKQQAAALQSPPTRSRLADPGAVEEALKLFGFDHQDLAPGFPAAEIHAGADHLALMLKSREKLRSMAYDLKAGRELMVRHGWVTILLCYSETPQKFFARNAFAYGGVYEDPATGAAAAALGGYLRDIEWPHGGAIEIYQGDDMGIPCRLHVNITSDRGDSVRVSGSARLMLEKDSIPTN
jgi:PhzF family phenazine biosynthesis protein